MRTLHKQLILNKRQDWQIALCDGITITGDSLLLASSCAQGYACLKAIDSGEKGFQWGRISFECVLAPDSMLLVRAYVSDAKQYGNSQNLDEFLCTLVPGSSETRLVLNELYTLAGQGDDCYINRSGRYLWLMLEWVSSGESPRLDAIRIHMSGDHMMDYLPAIYHKDDDFTRRFLSIFDSMLMDMERKIYDLPALFDYENAPDSMLSYLANWMCVDTRNQSREETIDCIRNATRDYEELYTVRGIRRSVQRLTGYDPLIIESADVDSNRPGCVHSDLYRRLYGENPYRFFILLAEDTFDSRAQMERFLEHMQELIPAGTEFDLVLLKRCVQLDSHTYLGVNAIVSDYVPVVIDENRTIHFDTMIGGN